MGDAKNLCDYAVQVCDPDLRTGLKAYRLRMHQVSVRNGLGWTRLETRTPNKAQAERAIQIAKPQNPTIAL